MQERRCPQCGGKMREDDGETIQVEENEDVVIDTYPAYICADSCGYEEQDDNRGDGAALEDEEGAGEPPNLFHFATSELSQDAFLCWLLSWARPQYRTVDPALHEAGREFIAAIFAKNSLQLPDIRALDVTRQFRSLDILVMVNDQYAILIEDKTHTSQHSNQLERYRETVAAAYPHAVQLPVYFKLADQSNYRAVEQAGYVPFVRTQMLEVLRKGMGNGVKNPIYVDYYQHLQQIEENVLSYQTKPIEEWDFFAWQGFYLELQKVVDGDWEYVPNQSGGFLGFWWDSAIHPRCYVQLEQTKLCVKVAAAEGEDKRNLRDSLLQEVLEQSDLRELALRKPARRGIGKTMTIAQRVDYLQVGLDGRVDIRKTIDELKKY